MSHRRDIHGKLTHLRKTSTSYTEVSTGARMTSPLSFCGGNPIMYVDPTGNDTIRVKFSR